ncbi:MAG: hypothetical protein DHS20C09_17680 [marine bacterium B5-7]|nr:MAG: hypothetical protein DHS20C09_17680 [marine bacterium B5-7]
MNERDNSVGFSLIELVIAIVILSVGVTGFITLAFNTTKNSVDPQIRVQGNAIARAYLEEIMLNSFCEPDFDPDGDPATGCATECVVSACNTAAPNACAGANSTGGAEVGRTTFDDVCDYTAVATPGSGLPDNLVRDQTGSLITSLSDYSVAVIVNDSGGVNLNGLSGNNGQVVRIDVTVTHTSGTTMALSGYKTNF